MTDGYELRISIKGPKPKDPFLTQEKLDMHMKKARKTTVKNALDAVSKALDKFDGE